jgi:hypothetical protein
LGPELLKLRPFSLPLFTGVRGIEILRIAPFGPSRKFLIRKDAHSIS